MTYEAITTIPVAGALGAEITGVDLSRPLDKRTLFEIRLAFADHQLLFFRDQNLTPEGQIAFAKQLGPLLRVPYVEPLADHPDIIAVLKEANECNISTFGGTWHTDFSFLENPPSATILYALEVPAFGGDTLWASMYAAYDALSAGMKATLGGLTAIHTGAPHGTAHAPPADLAVSRSIKLTRGDPAADAEIGHPVVRVHPVTGRRALFINPVYVAGFKGMTEAESKPLLDFLGHHTTRPEFTCRFSWRNGSLAIWDNRCTQHLAINDYDGERRRLHRITLAGERPIGAGEQPIGAGEQPAGLTLS